VDPDPKDPFGLCHLVSDPDPLVRGPKPAPYPDLDPNPKIGRKTLIPLIFLLLDDFLSLKNNVNVP
jgi:hypothetical protein